METVHPLWLTLLMLPLGIVIIADNKIRAICPIIDIANKTVTVTGWTKGTFRLAELEYN